MKAVHLIIFIGLASLFTATPAAAQGEIPAGNLMYSTGTTFRAAAQDYAYLLWMPTDQQLLLDRSYAIWSKAGGISSPGLFEPESLVRVQVEPLTIEAILRRAERLGQDLRELEVAIDGLFGAVTPGTTLSRAEKLSMVIQGALDDPDLFNNLLILARLHPAVSLCIGAGWVGPMDGLRTYEIRMCADGQIPMDPGDCQRVVGRIALDAGNYQPLPAPGAPVSIPFGSIREVEGVPTLVPDPRADLNVRLRWATPVELRRLTLQMFGYHVYRFSFDFFHDHNIAAGMLAGDASVYAQAFPEHVRRVNAYPVLTNVMLSHEEAADEIADPETFFVVDSNDRFEPGGLPFEDGDTFYYVVSAVDILGRDGLYSPATWVQVCRTMPPSAPIDIVVEDKVTYPDPSIENQVFGMSWTGGAPVDGLPVLRYYVYRWENPDDHLKATPAQLNAALRSPPLYVTPGAEQFEYDCERGFAADRAELNKTYWFTVRAATNNGCGLELLSPHSGPVAGILRDRRGPSRSVFDQEIELEILKSKPRVQVTQPVTTLPLPDRDNGYVNVRLIVTRTDTRIDAADFYYSFDLAPQSEPEDTPLGPAPPGGIYLGSIRFRSADDMARTLDYRFPLQGLHGQGTVNLHLRSRSIHGALSGFTVRSFGTADNAVRQVVQLTLSHSYQREVPSMADGLMHIPNANIGTIEKPSIKFKLSPLTAIWKIYRRIDNGPMTMVRHGIGGGPDTEVTIEEDLQTVTSGNVCYFLQQLDGSGFADPLLELGCFDVAAPQPPPMPMLLPVESLGDVKARVTWSCAPHGVARFVVGVSLAGDLPPDFISLDLGRVVETRTAVAVEVGEELLERDFRMYETGRVTGGAEHSVIIDVEPGAPYLLFVEAITDTRERGPASNIVAYSWVDPRDGGPDASWPARPLPPLNESFGALRASMGRIEIGLLPDTVTVQTVNGRERITPAVDPMRYLHREILAATGGASSSSHGRSLLPCVVYRYQVPNDDFPHVSGDVYQVTPMLAAIASRSEFISGADRWVNYDPWFSISANRRVYLEENRPATFNASYRYLIVLYKPNGEIEAVVPTQVVTAGYN